MQRLRTGDELLVEVGAVGRPEVLEHDEPALPRQPRMAAGGERILEPDLCRIAAADKTCPNVGELIVVLTPEYCTMFSAFDAVTRPSKLRVSPSGTVRESDPSTTIVPGSRIEFRDAFPYVPAAGAENAAVLNQFLSVFVPPIVCPATRFGRSELPAPEAISAVVPEYTGVA